MSKSRVIVLSVVHQGLSKAEAARRYNVSWQWVHTLVTRYQAGGLEAVDAQSRRPLSNSRATPDPVRERIVELRKQLDADGLDAGPVTIASHLTAEGVTAPSTSTIRRVLHEAGLITPAPKNAPAAPCTASPPTNPTSVGNQTSPTGTWPTAQAWRSSTGSMTTPGYCCR